jgi:hypothetical protein
MARHLEKGKGETYPDPTKYTSFGPEPDDVLDLDDHQAARYNADCETKRNNRDLEVSSRGEPHKRPNIHDIAGDAGRTKSPKQYYRE